MGNSWIGTNNVKKTRLQTYNKKRIKVPKGINNDKIKGLVSFVRIKFYICDIQLIDFRFT